MQNSNVSNRYVSALYVPHMLFSKPLSCKSGMFQTVIMHVCNVSNYCHVKQMCLRTGTFENLDVSNMLCFNTFVMHNWNVSNSYHGKLEGLKQLSCKTAV